MKAGNRARIIIDVNGAPHGILWLSLGKDGSLYLGERYAPTTEFSIGVVRESGRRFSFRDEDLQAVSGISHELGAHVSFHPTGALNISAQRYYREPLKSMANQEHYCSILFQHPTKYPRVRKKPRTVDVCLFYPVDMSRPMIGEIYLSRKGDERYVYSKHAEYQANIVFVFDGFSDDLDRSCQFVIWHSQERRWPEATYLIIPSGRRRTADDGFA